TRLWGPSWGEMFLFDATPSNFLNFYATGENFPGGALYLGNGVGPYSLILQGGAIGDASAILPTDAINAGEMLNEPGIASEHNSGSIALTAAVINSDTVTITAPTSGFIVVIADGFIEYDHTVGTIDVFRGSISSTSGAHDFDNLILDHLPANNPTETANLFRTFSRTKYEAVGAGVHTYYLTAQAFSGGVNISRRHLLAMFFPTAYGTVVSTKPVVSRTGGNVAASLDAAGANLPSEVQIITVEEHKAQLEAERAKQLAEMEARIKKLEETAKTGKQQVLDDNR
ncbi:MAG: hypothetical protein L0Z48_12365, partial [candidate division Zixibacteria bacterium]|nr:hypothetical protein [candidate division Zixibacteria bacterium]